MLELWLRLGIVWVSIRDRDRIRRVRAGGKVMVRVRVIVWARAGVRPFVALTRPLTVVNKSI